MYGESRSGREVASSSGSSKASNIDGLLSSRNVFWTLLGAVRWDRVREGRDKGMFSLSSIEGKPNSIASSNF